MHTNRCGHFSLEVEELTVSHSSVTIRVPSRRCALAEHMITILSRSEEGKQVANKIRIISGSETETNEIERIRVAFGPDLDVIHAAECTVERCQESCTPSYRMLLLQFGFEEDAARETGEGCLEINTTAVIEGVNPVIG